jgi:hypothetical protein
MSMSRPPYTSEFKNPWSGTKRAWSRAVAKTGWPTATSTSLLRRPKDQVNTNTKMYCLILCWMPVPASERRADFLKERRGPPETAEPTLVRM